MKVSRKYGRPILLVVAASLLSVIHLQSQQSRTPRNGDWPMFNRDLSGTRFSPLKQITTGNVANLKLAWTYQLRTEAERNRAGRRRRNRRLFPGHAHRRQWSDVHYRRESRPGARSRYRQRSWKYEVTGGNPSSRGVTYWPGDKENPPRIIFTAGRRMIGLNARTGQIDPGFGKEGTVDLVVPYNSPPTIYKNTLFVGANVGEQPATGPARRYARIRRPHRRRRNGNFIPSPGPANPVTKPGPETVEGPHRSQQLGLLHDRRREDGHRLHHFREPGQRLLRIRPRRATTCSVTPLWLLILTPER